MQVSERGLFWQGFRAALPLMVGVMPFGIVFGALAVNAGLSPLEALGMSVIVIAGSSQFVAAGLIADSTPALIIILTTFIINLRHFLYSASLTNFLSPISQRWKALIGYLMIDEVYATAMRQQRETPMSPDEFRWYFLGAGFNLALVWWVTTVIGAFVGDILPANLRDALGFTLPLIFTAIVVPLLVNRPALFSALSAAAVGIVFNPLPYNLGLLVAAGVGIAVGVWLEKPQEKAG